MTMYPPPALHAACALSDCCTAAFDWACCDVAAAIDASELPAADSTVSASIPSQVIVPARHCQAHWTSPDVGSSPQPVPQRRYPGTSPPGAIPFANATAAVSGEIQLPEGSVHPLTPEASAFAWSAADCSAADCSTAASSAAA